MLALVGLEVQLLDEGGSQQSIGMVTNLLHAGNDLLEVQLNESGRRILIPFVEAIVPVVQLEQGWFGITPPPGLLEL